MSGKTRMFSFSVDREHSATALRFAMSYIVFLLICLTLGLVLCLYASDTAQNNYWTHHAAHLDVDVSTADQYIEMMETYARQLSTDPTFVRFSCMNGQEGSDFFYTSYKVMGNLSMRQYGLSNLPVQTAHVYLPTSGHVISSSQFTRLDQFYRYYLNYPDGMMDGWLAALQQSGRSGSLFSLTPFNGTENSVALAYDIGRLLGRNLPAIVWFELDTAAIARQFLPDNPEAFLLLADNSSGCQITLSAGSPSPAQISALADLCFNAEGMAHDAQMQYIRREGTNGLVYTLALPKSMFTDALGNYAFVYVLIFLAAVALGLALVLLLVRDNMRPVIQLHSELTQARSDKDKMQREIDAQRPILLVSYLRRLLSGHITTDDEFAHLLRFLGLDGDHQYFVLYCNAYQQDDGRQDVEPLSPAVRHELILTRLAKHLTVSAPLRHYTTPMDSYVIVVTYDANDGHALADLEQRVMRLHNELAETLNIWFYAGVGAPCTQPRLLWESYEQARAAARYTAKSHIFLPYSFIRKDASSWYYPVEISAKLLHFITTGNSRQVSEMFALIHRENLEERTLSVPLLNYLLSDLKNTLLKARFQISPKQRGAQNQDYLSSLDLRLAEASTFHELEHLAISLCSLFTSTVEPADQIAEIQLYLKENFADPSLCLSKLSDLFNISESYLSHLFKDRTGQNFSVFLEDLRMSEAIRRLQNPECNLSELYADLGYSNAATFRRAFKKRFGVSPSEMRQQQA